MQMFLYKIGNPYIHRRLSCKFTMGWGRHGHIGDSNVKYLIHIRQDKSLEDIILLKKARVVSRMQP